MPYLTPSQRRLSRYGAGYNPEFERLRAGAGRISEYANTAQDIVGGIEGAYQPPPGTFATLERPTISALKEELKGGVSPQREAQLRRRVTQSFGATAGRYATGGARRGYFSKGGVGTAMAGAPSAALAGGLGQMQVGLEKERGARRQAAIRGVREFKEEMGRPRQAMGAFTGEMLRRQRTPSRHRRMGPGVSYAAGYGF